jgi:RNA polymerase sigma-70 factor, ECF subfamily
MATAESAMFRPIPALATMPASDIDLVVRCQSGDTTAFRELVLRFQRPVFAFLYRALGDSPDVEDLAQEVFVRAHRALARFDVRGPARLTTWLLTIATRLVQDERRRRAVRGARASLATTRPIASSTASPERERQRSELGRAIASAVEELPPEQRDAFVLAEYHDLAITEVSDVLGVPEATVKTRLYRAREKLRNLLGELWEETKS